MRLNVTQMRCIREMRIKRKAWCGKDVAFLHEHYGRVVFGSPPSPKNRCQFQKTREPHSRAIVRGRNGCWCDRMDFSAQFLTS